MNLSIHIATETPGTIKPGYLVTALAWHWERAGHQVTSGPVRKIDADIGILHFDRTRTVPEMIPEKSTHCPLLNESMLDISKSSFSTLRVLPGDSWDGPVIIKSDLNCFGSPEWHQRKRNFFERRRRKLARKFWRLARMLPPRNYPVVASLSEVPGWVWERSDIIVERFMPEREGALYCLRGWMFFGEKSYSYRPFSKSSVVKVGTITGDEVLAGPPPELEAFRKANRLDFGKFDYVEVDGRPILIDVNKTPTVPATRTNPDTPHMRLLASGLYDFIGET